MTYSRRREALLHSLRKADTHISRPERLQNSSQARPSSGGPEHPVTALKKNGLQENLGLRTHPGPKEQASRIRGGAILTKCPGLVPGEDLVSFPRKLGLEGLAEHLSQFLRDFRSMHSEG